MKKSSSKTKRSAGSKQKILTSKKSKRSSQASESDSQSGDISALILRDHKPIKELIMILKDPKATFATKQPAFEEFELLLSSHAKAEEETLYVHLKEVDDLRIEGLEGDTEHAIADQLMLEVNESEGDEDVWMAKVKVLAEVVDHHVKEEEKEVLKEARKEFSADEQMAIGEEYLELLNKYRQENGSAQKYSEKVEQRAEYA